MDNGGKDKYVPLMHISEILKEICIWNFVYLKHISVVFWHLNLIPKILGQVGDLSRKLKFKRYVNSYTDEVMLIQMANAALNFILLGMINSDY